MRRASLAVALAAALCGCTLLPREVGNAPAAPPHPAPPSQIGPPVIDSAALMIARATAMLGQPYRYGGAMPGGFDCSGLVAYAASGAGIPLPRTAREQWHAGVPVRRDELQRGDLVFMHLAHKELHVGIAIDGERFIHAPRTGGHVRIDSLAVRPYAAGFLGARRVIGPSGATAMPGSN